MPVVTFPFKEDLVGIRVRLPDSEGVWEVVEVCSFAPVVQLVLEEDMRLEPGRSKRSTTVTIQEFEKLIASAAFLSKPSKATPTSFVIFGHKSESVPALNEDEIARLETLDLTLLNNKATNTSWFGKLIKTDPISTKDIAAARKLLENECNMSGLDLQLHFVDFLQDNA